MVKKQIELLPIKNDYVFKRTFAYKGNEDVLMDLLEAILERRIEESNSKKSRNGVRKRKWKKVCIRH